MEVKTTIGDKLVDKVTTRNSMITFHMKNGDALSLRLNRSEMMQLMAKLSKLLYE